MIVFRHKRSVYATVFIYVHLYPTATVSVATVYPKSSLVWIVSHEYLFVVMVGAQNFFFQTDFLRLVLLTGAFLTGAFLAGAFLTGTVLTGGFTTGAFSTVGLFGAESIDSFNAC